MKFIRYESRFKAGKILAEFIENRENSIKNLLLENPFKFYNKDSKTAQFYKEKIQNKYIFIIDDGLASGFTMLAAISMLKKYLPLKIFIAVTTAPLRTVERIKTEIDKIFCPNIRDELWFAVADAYKNWYDVPESEVLKIISDSKYYISN